MELATIQSVQAEAARALADLARDALWGHAKHALAHRMEVQVRDDLGTVLRAKLLSKWFAKALSKWFKGGKQHVAGIRRETFFTSAHARRTTQAIVPCGQRLQPAALYGEAARVQRRAGCLSPLFAASALDRPSVDPGARFVLRDVVSARRYSTYEKAGARRAFSSPMAATGRCGDDRA